MRTSLILLLALGLTTATNAQTAMLVAPSTSTGSAVTPPDPGARPEARDLIAQVLETELAQPSMVKNKAKLVYIDVKGDAATARVEYQRSLPTKTFYYHLVQKDGQWTVTGRDGYAQVKM